MDFKRFFLVSLLFIAGCHKAPIAQIIHECELPNSDEPGVNCAVWTITNGEGTGNWETGATASLNVEALDEKTMILLRHGSNGLVSKFEATKGPDGMYRGVVSGEGRRGKNRWRGLLGEATPEQLASLRISEELPR